MSETLPPVWIAPLLGGTTLCLMSGVSSYYVEKDMPKIKALARDFILGAILVLCIMQFLPESVAKSVSMLLSLTALFSAKSVSSSLPTEILQAPKMIVPDFTGGIDDIDVRVGIPKF